MIIVVKMNMIFLFKKNEYIYWAGPIGLYFNRVLIFPLYVILARLIYFFFPKILFVWILKSEKDC
jgi:hypothetical protein